SHLRQRGNRRRDSARRPGEAAARHRGLLQGPDGRQPADLAGREDRAVQRAGARRERQQHEDRDLHGAGRRFGAANESRRRGRERGTRWARRAREGAAPRRESSGRGRRGGRANGLVRVTSPEGKWVARTQEKARPKADPKYASDFEKRHQERFKGAIFDWQDFQRDGAPFPVPSPAAAPALQIVVQPADAQGDAGAKTIVDLDLRPANLAWP